MRRLMCVALLAGSIASAAAQQDTRTYIVGVVGLDGAPQRLQVLQWR
jgi:hypothetical protein